MPTHTPGPWTVEDWRIVSEAYGKIATVAEPFHGGDREGADFAISNANARLIAAAPELLDVLKRTVAQSDRLQRDGCSRTPQLQPLYDAAVAAIAKAEGR